MRSIGGAGTLPERVERALRALGVSEGSGVLVGFSGGADSTCLLAALSELPGLRLRVGCCHVDHGLRGEEERASEVERVLATASRLGVETALKRIPPGEIASRVSAEARSTEEVARARRYRLLAEAAEAMAFDFIATGHTLDDQIETLLMRFLQGSLVSGLKGIPARRGAIIRPLLACSRSEVLAYLRDRGLDYWEDSSNASPAFLRNRVRRELVPVVRRIFPGVDRAMGRFAREMRDIDEALDDARVLRWESRGGGLALGAEAFARAPKPLRVRSLLRLYDELGASGRIPSRFFDPVRSYRLGAPSAPRRILLRGYGAELAEEAGLVVWTPRIVATKKKGYLISVDAGIWYRIDDSLAFMVERRASSRGAVSASGPRGMVVRSRRAGDAVRLGDGTKTLKRLFNEWRVSEKDRSRLPVVVCSGSVVAVLGQALGYRDCFAPADRDGDAPVSSEFKFFFNVTGERRGHAGR